jgi:SAM-dependent methyltransferase
MSAFNHYARYYDLLYKDKDYAGEAQHVHEIIQRIAPGAKTILELGCGTCGHAVHLAAEGYVIHGIDISNEMLKLAEYRLKEIPHPIASRISISHGDIRDIRLGQRFDVVIGLFHVISYLPTNDDLKATFKTAKIHLKDGGLFLFDCWYGPAVLTHPPSVQVKRMDDEHVSVVRIAEPVMHANKDLVEVNYQIFIIDKNHGDTEVVEETHVMRFLFKPEIDLLLSLEGFQALECFEELTGGKPGFDTWSVYFTGQL